MIVNDAPFRRFVLARTLLLSIALAPPFYVLLAQQRSESGLLGLGALVVANGLATSVSAPFWVYGGLIGLIGDWLGAAATVLVLGLLSLIAAAYCLKLPDVSEPY